MSLTFCLWGKLNSYKNVSYYCLSLSGIKHQDVKQRPSSAVRNCTSINVPNHRQATDLTSLENDVLKKKAKNVEKVKNLLDSKSGVSEKLKEELISVSSYICH